MVKFVIGNKTPDSNKMLCIGLNTAEVQSLLRGKPMRFKLSDVLVKNPQMEVPDLDLLFPKDECFIFAGGRTDADIVKVIQEKNWIKPETIMRGSLD